MKKRIFDLEIVEEKEYEKGKFILTIAIIHNKTQKGVNKDFLLEL